MFRFLTGDAGKVPPKYGGFLTTLDRHIPNTTNFRAKEERNGGKAIQRNLYLQLYGNREALQVLAQVFEHFVQKL
jgi:hypothetical protein